MSDELAPYWYSRLIFERGLALIYLIAFIAVVNQFVPLLASWPASRRASFSPCRSRSRRACSTCARPTTRSAPPAGWESFSRSWR